MVTGRKLAGTEYIPLDIEGEADSAGVPAAGQLEGHSYNTLGRPGNNHWQASFISRLGLDDRNNIFFAAVEMTRMPMVITDAADPDNPIAFVNKAFEDLTGYSQDEVLGKNCRFLQGQETDANTVAEIRKGIAEKRAVAVDILNYRKDGTPFWNALFLGPVFDETGNLIYWFSSQIDITRRRTSEQAFQQSQKMEAIGQLTAGLAHDFNNLLQVVVGNLEIVQLRLKGDVAGSRAAEQAKKAAEKGAKITQQLLTFSRKQRLDPKLVNLNGLIVDFSEMLVRALGTNMDLRLDLKPGLPSCMLDTVHLEMALLNVLINARDAMPNGGKVTVGTSLIEEKARTDKHGLQEGRYVALCVIDEGEGMSENVLRRATEPFFTTKGPGTGLGLAMVHGFMQQSKGKLEIDSQPSAGTTVRMIFPVTNTVSVRPSPQAEAPSEEVNDEQAKTVLVVDDSEDVRQLAETMLSSNGYNVVTAQSGEQALDILQERRDVSLLFSDILMPGGMNGITLANKVKKISPGIPILLTTGYMGQLSEEIPSAEAYPIITKPYRQTDLLTQIKKVFE